MLCLVALSVLMSLSKSCSPAMTWVLLAPRPVQCAAVMTYLGQMMVPPQKGVVPPRLTRAACQGMELGLASLPPTILTESSLLSKVTFFIPFPDQFKLWARVNCRKIATSGVFYQFTIPELTAVARKSANTVTAAILLHPILNWCFLQNALNFIWKLNNL